MLYWLHIAMWAAALMIVCAKLC